MMSKDQFADLWKGTYGPEMWSPLHAGREITSPEHGAVTVTAVDRTNLSITIDSEAPRESTQPWRAARQIFGPALRPRLPGLFAFASELADG